MNQHLFNLLENRRVRQVGFLAALAIEPCVHFLGAITGTYIPHPEGLGNFALAYFQTGD